MRAQDTRPFRLNPYRADKHESQELLDQVEEMRRDEVIQPSKSTWKAPVVLVEKKDGRLRVCTYYHRLKSTTKKDVYTLPLVDGTLGRLSDTRYVSSMGVKSGYWQSEVK